MYSIKLIPEQTFGKTAPPYLTSISTCVIDDKDRVIIWGKNTEEIKFPPPHSLHVYNADGTYHTQIGGSGRGPGEFSMLVDVQAKAGKIFTHDPLNMRINWYNTIDYSFDGSTVVGQWSVRNHEAVQGMKFAGIKTRNDGNHIAKFLQHNRPISKYLLIDSEGNVLNFRPLTFRTNFSVRTNTNTPAPAFPFSFMGNTITALSSKDEIYSIWTQDFLIRKYNAYGAYQSAIYYPLKGLQFDINDYTKTSMYSQSDIKKAYEAYGEDLPKTYPIVADLIADDENRIWVATHTGLQNENYEWWILNETGELLAKLLLPRNQPIYDIKNGYLYSKIANEETGDEYVVKYRIELTEIN